MSECRYFTCQELADRHGPARLFEWNASKIGVFYNCLLLDGKSFGKYSRVQISEISFYELLIYAYDIIGQIDRSPEYMGYDEVLQNIPQTSAYRWSNTSIGVLLHAGLLDGKKSSKEGRMLVTRQSVLNLVHYTDQRFQAIKNMPHL